jgi:hypothetical protein
MPQAMRALLGLLALALLVSCAEIEKTRVVIPGTEGQTAGTSEAPGEGPWSVPETTVPGPAAVPAVPGSKAGLADDNRQFNYFLQFLEQYGKQVPHLPIPVGERIVLEAVDSEGKPLDSAAVEIYSDTGRLLCSGLTYSDGRFLFFPQEFGPSFSYRAVVTVNEVPREAEFQREGPREVPVRFDFPRPEVRPLPLDMLFILDTTSSMGEQVERLKSTIGTIALGLSSLSPRPQVRFGLVIYRDRGDIYLDQVVPFTANLDEFQVALNRVKAEGGGDVPDDLQAALKEAMGMEWNGEGLRLAFVITDAPPHLDYGESYTYVDAAHDASSAGIKIFTVGSGGLDLAGEYVLRQLSQYTSAKYVLLAPGGQGQSEGGAPASVGRHTGAGDQTDELEQIVIRLAKEELGNALGQPPEAGEDYFQATRVAAEQPDETLQKLFTLAVSQLIDDSSLRLAPDTPASVLPLSPAAAELAQPAEQFTEQLTQSFRRSEQVRKTFRLLQPIDLPNLLQELQLQPSGLADEKQAARVGGLIGAQVLVIGRLYAKGEDYELFLELLRVETGEALSATKAVIDRRLGLGG